MGIEDLFKHGITDIEKLPPRPVPEAYWVVPGRLLAGPYPGAYSATRMQEKLHLFLDAGIELFFDLTEPGEGLPYAHELRGRARHTRRPIRDFDVPTPAQMRRILDALDFALQRQRVYLHCVAGLGRTGTVVGCFLVRHGCSGEEALTTLQHLRKGTPFAHDPSPQTVAQRQMVVSWSRRRSC